MRLLCCHLARVNISFVPWSHLYLLYRTLSDVVVRAALGCGFFSGSVSHRSLRPSQSALVTDAFPVWRGTTNTCGEQCFIQITSRCSISWTRSSCIAEADMTTSRYERTMWRRPQQTFSRLLLVLSQTRARTVFSWTGCDKGSVWLFDWHTHLCSHL